MSERWLVMTLCALVAGACSVDGQAWSGATLGGDDPLVPASANEGVYPDQSVLADPANPFAQGMIGETTIWKLQESGGPVKAFYAWATLLARGPNGERQFYAAINLKTVYESALAGDSDMPVVRDLAIRGFQAVLDHFPDAVTYDKTGTIAWDLATPSVEHIQALGGKVQGGWVLVTTDGGGKKAVRP